MVTLYEITKRLIEKNKLEYENFDTEEAHHRHVKEFRGMLNFLGIPQEIFKEHSSVREGFKFTDDSIEKITHLLSDQKNIKDSIKAAVKKKDLLEFTKKISPVMDFLEAQFKDSTTNLEQCKSCIQYKFRIEEASVMSEIEDKWEKIMSTSKMYPFDQPVLYRWYIDQLQSINKNLGTIHENVEGFRKQELSDIEESLNDSRKNYKLLITTKDIELLIKSYEEDIKWDLKFEYTINLICKLYKTTRSQKTNSELNELVNGVFNEYSKRKSIPFEEREEIEKKYGKYDSVLGLTIYIESVIDSLNKWKNNNFKGKNKYLELLYEAEEIIDNDIITLPRNIGYFEHVNSIELINDFAQDALDTRLKP